jgi:hypothetical protein
MGILDDAIKEHLELKRQHGAGDDELKKLEDEAFGAAERPGEPDSAPDAVAEAPTEFMAQPEVAEPAEADESGEERRPRPDIADLQEAPPPAPEAPLPEAEQESAPQPEEPPAEEEAPAIEQAIPEPPAAPEPEPPAGPSTAEREAIAEQPTEMYDVEEELGGSEAPAPSEEELVEEEIQEPRLAPVDPLSGVTDAEEEEEDEQEADDFFDEQRLSDELDQALEGPSEVEDEEALYEDAATEAEDDAELAEEELEDEEEQEDQEPPAEHQEEDVLEETPDFLEEAPEDDQLWFEQKPPKDFDFDD